MAFQNRFYLEVLKIVSSQKRGGTFRRFERLNLLFEKTFGTVIFHPQNIGKILKIARRMRKIYNQHFTKKSCSGDFSRFLLKRLTRSGYYAFVIY
jgi:hypothetical protein